MKKLFLLFLAFFLFLPLSSQADGPAAAKSIPVYIFTQQGCPYCAEVLALLEELKQSYPGLKVLDFDMKANAKYINAYAQMAKAYGISPDHVPVTYIGAKAIEGINKSTIKEAIEYCSLPVNECIDPGKYIQEATLTDNNVPAKTQQELIGWVVIGIILVGGGILLIYKLR